MSSVTSYAYANPGPYAAEGKTNPANPWTNYTENGMVGQAAVETQIYELGNSIDYIENGVPAPGSLSDPSQDPGQPYLIAIQTQQEHPHPNSF